MAKLINQSATCLLSIKEEQWLWLKKLRHANMRLISKLNKHNLMRGLPSLIYKTNVLCETYQKGKQAKTSFD